VGWLALIVGAFAGMLLFVAAEQGALHNYIVTSPRATTETINRWTVLMSMPFLAGCLVSAPFLFVRAPLMNRARDSSRAKSSW